MDRPGALAAIGGTPVVRLSGLVGPDDAEVWVKLESANPTGSYKDRMALAMIEGAERSGRLRPGQTVVEYTGGSTGSSLAFVCAIKGYPLRIVSATCFAEEKIQTMRAFGATVELIDSPEGITPTTIPRMMARATEIVAETGGYPTDQFRNTDMVDGYLALGRELAEQLDGRLDAIVLYVGHGRLLPGDDPGAARAHPGAPSGRGRAGGVAGARRRDARHPSDRRWRGRLPAAAARAGRHRRGHRGVSDGRDGDGAPCGAGGRRLVRPVDRREPDGSPRGRPRLGPSARVATVQVDSGLKYLRGEVYA